MPEIENKLKEMGLELPPPRPPGAGNIIPFVRTGNLVFLSGTGPGLPGGGLLHTGKLGSDLTVEQGYDCARQTMLNLLTNLKGAIGDLDNVRPHRQAPLHGQLRARLRRPAPGGQRRRPTLLIELYGDRGRHARSAVGMATLPGGMPIEIEMIVEVED